MTAKSRRGGLDGESPATGYVPAATAVGGYGRGGECRLQPLIARIAAGEEGALEELYDQTAGKLFGFAHFIVRDQEDAEEVVCDVYLQVWRAPLRYDAARGSVLAWLFGICRARAIDRCRRNRARVLTGIAPADAAPENAEGGELCDLLERLEQGSAIALALTRLSPVRRQILALAFFRGLSHGEIAIETKLPIGTVKSHIRRALSALRGQIGPGIHGA